MSCQDRLWAAVWRTGFAAFALKLLLFPAAHSTDLEVHRWWKALTYTRPLREWYTDVESEWTLDYPPLFAYFERALAAVAARFHPTLLDPHVRNYDAPAALLFMRLSVVSTDAVLVYSVYRLVSVAMILSQDLESVEKRNASRNRNEALSSGPDVIGEESRPQGSDAYPYDKGVTSAALVLFNPGLFLVDNIHFQYNGFVLSLLLLSLSLLMENRLRTGAFVFTLAVNLKHTLVSVAPPIAFYLLASVCLQPQSRTWAGFTKSVSLIMSSVIGTLFVIWLPLFASGGPDAVLACLGRMFPFGRGLLHAFWAPNFWALYAGVDKALAFAGCRLRIPDVDVSSGHIGARRPFVCLPNVSPRVTSVLVLGAIVPVLCNLSQYIFRRRGNLPRSKSQMALSLPRLVSFCALSAFVLGWHVHEKMVLLATVPLGASVMFEASDDNGFVQFAFLIISLAGNMALHPLVRSPVESTYKVLHYLAYAVLLFPALDSARISPGSFARKRLSMRRFCALFGIGCVIVEWYAGIGRGHELVFGLNRLEFFPLLLVSTFCGVGVLLGHLALLAHIVYT